MKTYKGGSKYSQKNHMVPAAPLSISSEQTRKKVRVVFDAAARFSCTSLNEQFLQGPSLTNDLSGVFNNINNNGIYIALIHRCSKRFTM